MYSNGYVPAYGTGIQANPWVLATQTGYKEFWENTIQTNITLEQNLDFLTKGLRFVARFGFDTWNKNNIERIKWPEQWRVQRRRDDNGNLYSIVFLRNHPCSKKVVRKVTVKKFLRLNCITTVHSRGIMWVES